MNEIRYASEHTDTNYLLTTPTFVFVHNIHPVRLGNAGHA